MDRIFARLEAFYGARLADAWKGSDVAAVKRVWAEELAAYTADEVRKGLDACRARDWPPTLPEFLKACRPPLDYEAAFLEAVEQMRLRDEGKDKWTRGAAYWAAVRLGRDLQTLPYVALKGRWHTALDAAAAQVASGELPAQVPVRTVSLPAPGGTSASKERVREHLAALVASLKATKPDPLAWARKILARQAAGEDVGLQAELMARKALNLDGQPA